MRMWLQRLLQAPGFPLRNTWPKVLALPCRIPQGSHTKAGRSQVSAPTWSYTWGEPWPFCLLTPGMQVSSSPHWDTLLAGPYFWFLSLGTTLSCLAASCYSF